MNKIDWKSITIGLVWTTIILLVMLTKIFYVITWLDVFIAISITELGVGLIWLFITYGMFSTTRYTYNKAIISRRDSKLKKHGVFIDGDKKNKKKDLIFKEKNTALDYEKRGNKSRQGIYLMIIVGLVILISTLIASL